MLVVRTQKGERRCDVVNLSKCGGMRNREEEGLVNDFCAYSTCLQFLFLPKVLEHRLTCSS